MWNLEEITEEIYGGIDFIGTKKFKDASHRGIKLVTILRKIVC